MDKQKHPPTHPMITIFDTAKTIKSILPASIVPPSIILKQYQFSENGICIDIDEAISLGLALMETGLFLKQKRKDEENVKS